MDPPPVRTGFNEPGRCRRGVDVLSSLNVSERLFEKSSIGGISSVHFRDERQSIPYRPH